MGRRGEGWFLVQLLLFALILLASRVAPGEFPVGLRVLGAVALATGGIFGTLGVLALGRNLSPFPKPIEGGTLVTTGVYGMVRHPIYAGLILGTLGWGLLMSSLLGVGMAAVLFLFFDQKSRREEAWLAQSYAGYAGYQKQVRKLIPWVY